MHIGLFFTFGLIFVLWVYMGVHGLTNSRWQEHMKIYLWIFIWVLLAAAITIWPDTQYIRAVVTGLPFTVGFYLNVATVHLTVWDVWSPVAAGADRRPHVFSCRRRRRGSTSTAIRNCVSVTPFPGGLTQIKKIT